jgi:hypothetical protein
MQRIGEHRHRAAADQRADDGPRQQIEAGTESPKASPRARKQHPDAVESVDRLGAHRVDVTRDQHDPEQPDRQVDEENPVPGKIGGDEAAERRPDHRADQ